MPGQALARKDVGRALVLASRAGHPVRDRVAVRSVLPAEMMPLDDAGEALADGHALHVDLLADLEDLDADPGADLQAGELVGLAAEFLQRMPCLDARLGDMPGEGLDRPAPPALA